ncbi:MAG: CHRD domain-containing protein [Balneolaceae bacterium]|nr:CHRD domain-containing protein [Balneolaceae bacterium]
MDTKKLFHMAIGLLVAAALSAGSVSVSAAQETATVVLAGYKVNPPVSTPAAGTALVTYRNDSLFVEGSFSDLNSFYRGAGIHYGTKRENGNQVLKLSSELNEDHTGGTFRAGDNAFKLTEALKTALGQGRLYINIYTQMQPRGELRGQIPALSG